MAAARQPRHQPGLAVRSDQPLIGIVIVEDGQEVTRYFAEESVADAVGETQTAADARGLAGEWSDLDWEEMAEELDRIRHESTPTPPIDEP